MLGNILTVYYDMGKVMWDAAALYCISNGMQLVTIDSAAKQIIVMDTLNATLLT